MMHSEDFFLESGSDEIEIGKGQLGIPCKGLGDIPKLHGA